MRKLFASGTAVVTFTGGVLVSTFTFNAVPPPSRAFVTAEFLSPAREWHPMLDPDSQPRPSNLYVVVRQPSSEAIPEPDLIEGNCGTLLITVDGAGNIALNEAESIGTSGDTRELTRRLRFIFAERVRNRAYLVGMGARTDLPEVERIPRTILIKASRSSKYEDVLAVVELVKGLGANPISLQVSDLPE